MNGDGRLDVFVAGYTDVNTRSPAQSRASPPTTPRCATCSTSTAAAPARHPTFREVGRAAGLEPRGLDHGLGASFVDVDRDGRLDLYVANDLDPNRLYFNVACAAAARSASVSSSAGRRSASTTRTRGWAIAAGDYSGDGLDDLFVTNSRGQLHAAYRSRAGGPFADARPDFSAALGQRSTGWGATWVDLDLDGRLELALANGAIPVTNLARTRERLQVVSTANGDVAAARRRSVAPRNGRGLAAADFDNDGDLDLALGSIGGRLQLLRNDGAKWALARGRRFRGSRPGRRVTVVLDDGRRLVREARAGSSYLSSEDPRLHFGLGDATRVREVVVRYPGGAVTRLAGRPRRPARPAG